MKRKIGLTIGKLAREAGVSVETIRYYHKRGLLDQPAKPDTGGYRAYCGKDVGRIRFIKNAQQMGFSLAEIGELLTHVLEMNCHATKELTKKKLRSIEDQLINLEKTREALNGLVTECSLDCEEICQIIRKLHAGFVNSANDGGGELA